MCEPSSLNSFLIPGFKRNKCLIILLKMVIWEWCWCKSLDYDNHHSVADSGFQPVIWQNSCQKLHEKERILDRDGGSASLHPPRSTTTVPLDSPFYNDYFKFFLHLWEVTLTRQENWYRLIFKCNSQALGKLQTRACLQQLLMQHFVLTNG